MLDLSCPTERLENLCKNEGKYITVPSKLDDDFLTYLMLRRYKINMFSVEGIRNKSFESRIHLGAYEGFRKDVEGVLNENIIRRRYPSDVEFSLEMFTKNGDFEGYVWFALNKAYKHTIINRTLSVAYSLGLVRQDISTDFAVDLVAIDDEPIVTKRLIQDSVIPASGYDTMMYSIASYFMFLEVEGILSNERGIDMDRYVNPKFKLLRNFDGLEDVEMFTIIGVYLAKIIFFNRIGNRVGLEIPHTNHQPRKNLLDI